MNKLKICFDVDGTVSDTYGLLHRKLIENYDVDTYDLKDRNIVIPGKTEEQVHDIIHDIIINHTELIEPYEDAKKTLKSFYDLYGEPITFVSARPEYLHAVTKNWFKHHYSDLFEYKIICCESYIHKPKHLINFDYYVEDEYKVAELVSESIDKVFLINRKWNQDFKIDNHKIRRINLLHEVYDWYVSKHL